MPSLWLAFFLHPFCNQVRGLSTSCSTSAEGAEHQHGESIEHQHPDDIVSLLQTSVNLQLHPFTTAKEVPSETKLAALSRRTWQGEDLVEEDHDAVRTQLFDTSSLQVDLAGHSIKVVGMFGSGTNLMTAFIESNFGLSVTQGNGTCSPITQTGEKEEEEGQRCQVPCQHFWKHTHPFRIEYFDDSTFRARPTALVAMVRNPVSQMASWQRMPFNLKGCSATSGECTCAEEDYGPWGPKNPYFFPCGANATDDLSTNFGTSSSSKQCQLRLKGLSYPSLMGVWNSYTSGYEFLARGNMPMKVIVVRYEDLVQDPLAMLSRIAIELGAEVPSDPLIISRNARSFDPNSNDRTSALETIDLHLYRHDFSETTRRKMCEEFDSELLTKLGYQNECKFD